MTTQRRSALVLAIALALAALVATPAHAALVKIISLPKALEHPDEIAPGPDGALWFTQFDSKGPVGGVLGRITTAGVASVVGVPATSSPTALTTGPDGALWYTAWGKGKSLPRLGRVAPAGVSEVELPPGSRTADSIVTGPDRALWFTAGRRVGRLVPGGSLRFFDVPGVKFPLHIVSGSDGALWLTDLDGPSIGRITTSGAARSFRLPIPESADDLAAGVDGALWFTSFRGKSIGRVTTSGRIRMYQLPDPDDAPVSIAAGPDGAMWFTRVFGIARITVGGEITELDIPEGTDDLTLQDGITAGPDGAMWFSQQTSALFSDAHRGGEIGRIDLPGSARQLLVARLTDPPLRARRNRTLRISFASTRSARGELLLRTGRRTALRRSIRALAGANSVTLRLPRGARTYRLQLRLRVAKQVGSDSALLKVTR